ncbi:MAG: B12-binding domain-containing radical SAM protein [Ardenticatenaceae bacterium]|nr:B12-binding domain-containing radical SAM protein [Ardenticatenaceae bacterium]
MIILYNPQSNAGRKCILPMSLLALGALLEGQHDYILVDGNIETDPLARLDELIRTYGARVLGVTVMPGPQLTQAVPLCRELKARHPGLTIVWGGYFPTQHFDVCLRAPYVDYVVRGHGEFAFKALVDAIAGGDTPAARAGLVERSRANVEGSATEYEPSTFHPQPSNAQPPIGVAPIPHPDHLPDFPYHRVDMPRYLRRTFLGQRTAAHHSSYGCPFLCNFCAVVNMVNGRWLAQSAERTARVVRHLVQAYGADAVEFFDNNFFVHEARTAEFAERIRDLRIGWWGEARIDTLLKYSDRTWRLMAESGLRMAFMGAESGSDETLRRMNKGGTARAEKTLEIAARMKQYGIVPEFSFVLGNPPEPEADIRTTVEFIRTVKRVNPASEIIMYMYTPVPLAGELYEQARAEGFHFPETLEAWVSPEWYEFSQRRSTGMPWLKDPLRRSLHDFERVLNAYYPTATDPKLTRSWRWLLKTVSAWRYHLRFYSYPLELRVLHKFLAYQRPETSGF